MEPNFHVVLLTPQIPNNTGNIGRLCVGMGCKLHLIKPLGFEISDTRVKRAGLDYWPNLDWALHEDFDSFLQTVDRPKRMFFFTAHTQQSYYEVAFQPGDWLIFGREADGLPPEILAQYQAQCLTIPVLGEVRSFNLANAVAMALSQALRPPA